jgi:hypothetical protein
MFNNLGGISYYPEAVFSNNKPTGTIHMLVSNGNPRINPNYNSYRFPIEQKRPAKSYSQNKNKNDNINNVFNRNNISININKITEQNSEKENGNASSRSFRDINDISNLEISKEILTELPQESKSMYAQIISFLKEESASIEKEKQELHNQDMINNNLQSLEKNCNFIKYKNDFDNILSQEQTNSKINKMNLDNKIRLFKKIESFWEETLYYIYNNYSKSENVKIKLNNIIGNIKDYKRRFNNDKNDFNEHFSKNKIFMEKSYSNRFYNNNISNNRYYSSDKKYY